MEFTYLKNQFIGDGVKLYSNRGIHIEVGDKEIVFKNWDDLKDFMVRFEEINLQAALTKRRQTYGKDLIINYDSEEGEWIVFWKGQSLILRATLLRELDQILRYFLKMYHKLMLDYGTHKLQEGFVVKTHNVRAGAMNTGL